MKIKDNLKIEIPDSALSVKKMECEVISNKNVATFIKEFCVRVPEGEHIEFKIGEYIQIDIPAYELDFKDIDVSHEYRADWEKYGFFNLHASNPSTTIRAYSMASYPGEKGIIKINVRIATPPFDFNFDITKPRKFFVQLSGFTSQRSFSFYFLPPLTSLRFNSSSPVNLELHYLSPLRIFALISCKNTMSYDLIPCSFSLTQNLIS